MLMDGNIPHCKIIIKQNAHGCFKTCHYFILNSTLYYRRTSSIIYLIYSTRTQIAAFVALSLRERAGVRAFKKAQIVTVRSIV
jgi:hypothetical protein